MTQVREDEKTGGQSMGNLAGRIHRRPQPMIWAEEGESTLGNA